MNKILESDLAEIVSRVDLKRIKGKKILVTGATGFLGQYIVGALSMANREGKLGAKIHTIGFSDPHGAFASILANDPSIKFSRIDLSKPFQLGGYDFIFHAAGYGQPSKFIKDYNSTVAVNIDATHCLLDASPKASFVFFSSAEIYGEIPKKLIPVKEDFNGNSPLHIPRSVYAESKRLGEALCAAYKMDKKRDIKIVRISHTYGPGLAPDDGRVMSEFIKKALIDKRIKLLDAGRSVKTYGYIADSVAMILFIGFHGKSFVYNVGGKDSVSILELAKKISKYCVVPHKVPKITSKLAFVGKDPGIVKLDLTRIKTEMKGFNFLSFSEGLARTIEWTKEQIQNVKNE